MDVKAIGSASRTMAYGELAHVAKDVIPDLTQKEELHGWEGIWVTRTSTKDTHGDFCDRSQPGWKERQIVELIQKQSPP
jgi:hypothetical protein